MSQNTNSASGPGLPTILFVVFLILKLTDVITWSWWWVTAPLWIPFGLFLVVAIPVFIIVLCSDKYERTFENGTFRTIRRGSR